MTQYRAQASFIGAVFLSGRHNVVSFLESMEDATGESYSNQTVPSDSDWTHTSLTCDLMNNRRVVNMLDAALDPQDRQHKSGIAVNYALSSFSNTFLNPIAVPSRSKEILEVVSGEVDGGGDRALSKLCAATPVVSPRIPVPEGQRQHSKATFSEVIAKELAAKAPGHYSGTVLNLGAKSSFLVAARGVYAAQVCFVMTRHVLACVFTDSETTLDRLQLALEENHTDLVPVFTRPITVNESVIVINPMFLASKWRKERDNPLTKRYPLRVLNIINRYVASSLVSLKDTK